MELLDFIVSYSSVCLSYKPATPSRQGPASFLFVWQIVGSQEMFGGGWRVGGWVMRGESAVPQSRGPCSAEDNTVCTATGGNARRTPSRSCCGFPLSNEGGKQVYMSLYPGMPTAHNSSASRLCTAPCAACLACPTPPE